MDMSGYSSTGPMTNAGRAGQPRRGGRAAPTVSVVNDAERALSVVTPACTADPIGTNLLATALVPGPDVRLLHVAEHGVTLGLAAATPTGATLAPLDRRAAGLLAAALPTGADLDLIGRPDDVAAVAGAWTERCGGSADASELFRIHRYRAGDRPVTPVPGRLEVAAPSHRERAVAWMTDFGIATASSADSNGAREVVDTAAARGNLLVWEVDGDPVAQLIVAPVRFGVLRVGLVYTPPERRGCGYAAAMVSNVAELASRSPNVRDVVINPQASNAAARCLYRRIGFEPVGDLLRLVVRPGTGGGRRAADATGVIGETEVAGARDGHEAVREKVLIK